MEEVENKESVIEQVAPAETETHAEPVAQKVVASEESQEDRDFRAVRRRKKELEDTVRMQQELIERLRTPQQAQAAPAVDEIDSIGADEYIPKGKVDKLVERRAKAIAKEEVEQIFRQRDQAAFLDKLKSQYVDFNEIVNPDTLALLEEKEPELASTIADLKDPYKMGVQSYKYIKALNLSSKVPESRRAKEVEKKLDDNAKTVQSPLAYDKRPMAQAYKMSESDKNKLYEEMMGFASQAG